MEGGNENRGRGKDPRSSSCTCKHTAVYLSNISRCSPCLSLSQWYLPLYCAMHPGRLHAKTSSQGPRDNNKADETEPWEHYYVVFESCKVQRAPRKEKHRQPGYPASPVKTVESRVPIGGFSQIIDTERGRRAPRKMVDKCGPNPWWEKPQIEVEWPQWVCVVSEEAVECNLRSRLEPHFLCCGIPWISLPLFLKHEQPGPLAACRPGLAQAFFMHPWS